MPLCRYAARTCTRGWLLLVACWWWWLTAGCCMMLVVRLRCAQWACRQGGGAVLPEPAGAAGCHQGAGAVAGGGKSWCDCGIMIHNAHPCPVTPTSRGTQWKQACSGLRGACVCAQLASGVDRLRRGAGEDAGGAASSSGKGEEVNLDSNPWKVLAKQAGRTSSSNWTPVGFVNNDEFDSQVWLVGGSARARWHMPGLARPGGSTAPRPRVAAAGARRRGCTGM